MDTIHYSNCPLCNSGNIKYQLTAKDYTVSRKTFEIWQCHDCTFKFTQGIPTDEKIGKYYQSEDYVSHSDTKKGVINRLYHTARDIMLKQKLDLLESFNFSGEKTLLDVGCGTGYFANIMQQNNWRVQGIEMDKNARNYAIDKFNLKVSETPYLFELKKKSFDVITMWHVLEHVHTLDEYMQQLFALLKDEGRLVIAVPNCASNDAKHYFVHWAGWDVPRHLYHFTPKTMETLAKKHQFRVIDKKGMPFDPFYVSMLSEKYKGGMLSFVKGMWHGGWSFLNARKKTDEASSVIYVMEKIA